MSIDSINNYGASGTSSPVFNTSSKSDNSTLDMDDFFKLMVAQLSNQDMYNTVDDTQFMAQMAQFSMVQALSDMSELSLTAYGVSLIGKEVTVAKIDSTGEMVSSTGLVDSVNFYNGSTQVMVDGKSYDLSSVMSVKEPAIIIPTDPDDSEKPTDPEDPADPADPADNTDNTGGTDGDGDV